MKILRDADAEGSLENAKKWQVLDLDKIQRELDAFQNPEQKISYLKDYPSLAMNVLPRLIDGSMRTTEYENWCKKCKEVPQDYYLYVHGILLPYFAKERAAG